MKSKAKQILILSIIFFTSACTSPGDANLDVYENYTGTFIWGGQPAVDGVGLLFETEDATYGIPGDRSDFSGLFTDGSNSVEIKTDFVITGKKTVRGWGATFPEAILIRPERL